MENNDQYRNMTLSLKVTASQKAGYVKIASSLNLTLSEWLSSIIEMNNTFLDVKVLHYIIAKKCLRRKNI